jgi:soluble lytic murein transglycosylase-like protein
VRKYLATISLLACFNQFAFACSYQDYSVDLIDKIIDKNASEYSLDGDLIWAVIKIESHFNPCAVSPAGAQGLMQLMPGTASDLGVEDSFNPEENIRGGTEYLAKMLVRYETPQLALSAYNAGSRRVLQYRRPPPFKETQKYIRLVMFEYDQRKRLKANL